MFPWDPAHLQFLLGHPFLAIKEKPRPGHLIEPLSLDEAYLDVTENLQGITSASQIAEDIRAKIFGTTGLTASAGISYNKFLTKLASDHRKPNGQFVITPIMGPEFAGSLPIKKFHSVGPATAAKMGWLGISTGLDLRAQTMASCSSISVKLVLIIIGLRAAPTNAPFKQIASANRSALRLHFRLT